MLNYGVQELRFRTEGRDQQRVLGISVCEARKTLMNRTIRALGKVSMAPPSRIISPCDGIIEQVYQNPGATGSLRIGAGEQILSIASSSEKGRSVLRGPSFC